ncbi:hypothetical protein QTN25_005070 [Entamoeba marina]
MFAFLALLVLASATIISIPITTDDNDNVDTFNMYEIDTCYIQSSDKVSIKVVRQLSGYYKEFYQTCDCSGASASSLKIRSYYARELDYVYSTFQDTVDCYINENKNYDLQLTYHSPNCLNYGQKSQKNVVVNGEVIQKVYSEVECDGTSTNEFNDTCGTCENGNYVFCDN